MLFKVMEGLDPGLKRHSPWCKYCAFDDVAWSTNALCRTSDMSQHNRRSSWQI
jgi:hypothetical protein